MSADSEFKKFVEIVKALRTPVTGCPWDLEQTHESIRPYLIEEAYEVLDAIEKKDDSELRAELGDLLLQVVLHAQIADDRKAFTIEDVVKGVAEKMVRRHPHVFGDVQVDSSQQVLKNWEQIKLSEKSSETADEKPSVLSGVPRVLPALLRAQRIGEKAAKVNFDWTKFSRVLEDFHEEVGEFEDELTGENIELPRQYSHQSPEKQRVSEELGDILFSAAQLARWLGISSEDALSGACDRFTARFQHMEQNSEKPIQDLSQDQLVDGWDAAKKATKDPQG